MRRFCCAEPLGVLLLLVAAFLGVESSLSLVFVGRFEDKSKGGPISLCVAAGNGNRQHACAQVQQRQPVGLYLPGEGRR